jgi:hypothetical protein
MSEQEDAEKWNELLINAALVERSVKTEKDIRNYVV